MYASTLKQLRITNNISQEKLAEIIGISARSISRYESDTVVPPVDAALKLAAYYGKKVEEIFIVDK